MEQEQGWDPEVSAFFIRIINAIAITLFWMLTASTIGLYAGLAIPGEFPIWVTVLYYLLLVLSFAALVHYLRNAWKKHHK
jgi:hypothetical protein